MLRRGAAGVRGGGSGCEQSGEAEGRMGRAGPTRQPTNTTPSGSGVFAQGDGVSVPELNEPLQRPQGGPEAT